MRALRTLALAALLLPALTFGQRAKTPKGDEAPAKPPLEARIDRFDVTDAILRDGLSVLSLKNIQGLHLGFEEIIRGKIQEDPRALSVHFSLHLANKSVRQVLDALCESDARYAWSEDAASVNVYPRAARPDPSYLLNLRIDHIAVNSIPDPDQGLTPLSKLFIGQQIGYFGPGLGDNSYPEPWTTTFEHLTVRQFINRMAEHMGEQTSWVWQGGRDERMFTFLKGGFHSSREKPGTDGEARPSTADEPSRGYGAPSKLIRAGGPGF